MSVKKNFLYNVAYQALVVILPLITAPYLSRVLGSSGLGTYSYSYSIANYFVLFAMLGVNNYGNRAVALIRDDKHSLRNQFWSIWTMQAALSVIFLTAYIGYSCFVAKDYVSAIVWTPYVLSAALDVNWLFFGLEKFKLTVTRNFIVKVITFALTFIVVRGENALQNYLILMSLSSLVSVGVLWPFVGKEVGFPQIRLKGVLAHIKPNLILFIPVIAVSFYTLLDKVMLGQMSGMSETGLFENSIKITQVIFTFVAALGTVMLPHSTNLFAKGRHREAVDQMSLSMWFAQLMTAALMFGLIAIAWEFAPVFFGAGFEACSLIMTIIVLDMPLRTWANVIRTQWLIPTSQDRAYVASVVAGAVVNLIANFILIPLYGAVGAAISTFVAEGVVCVVQTIAVAHNLPLFKWVKDSVPSFVIGAMMLIGVRLIASFLPLGVVGLLVEIFAGVVLFTTVSLAWFTVSKNSNARALLLPIVSKMRRG